MRRLVMLVVAIGFAACGRTSSPVPPPVGPPPSPLPPTSAAETWAVGGRVTATLTGEGVGGVRLSSTPNEASTDAEGHFTFIGEGARDGALPVLAEHPDFVPRETRLRWAPARDDASVDLIRNAPPFTLDFYRQFVRASLHGEFFAGQLQPLRRWTSAPSWYLNTVTMDTGEAVPVEDLNQVEATLRAVVPIWTGGTFYATVIERGTTPPVQSGWITVRFRREPEAGGEPYCGRALVASSPGWVELILRPTSIFCCSGTIHGALVAHEVGHALGFWHVEGSGAEHVMSGGSWSCASALVVPSEIEQHHARIAYARQPGNTDPDNDPTNMLPLWSGFGGVEVRCGR